MGLENARDITKAWIEYQWHAGEALERVRIEYSKLGGETSTIMQAIIQSIEFKKARRANGKIKEVSIYLNLTYCAIFYRYGLAHEIQAKIE